MPSHDEHSRLGDRGGPRGRGQRRKMPRYSYVRRRVLAGLSAAAFLLGAAPVEARLGLKHVTYDPAQPVLGNPKGDVTIVEVFDYACPTCKALHPHLKQIVVRQNA